MHTHSQGNKKCVFRVNMKQKRFHSEVTCRFLLFVVGMYASAHKFLRTNKQLSSHLLLFFFFFFIKVNFRKQCEQEMSAHSGILAQKLLWTEKPDGLQSMSHKELDMTESMCMHTHIHVHTHTQSSSGLSFSFLLNKVCQLMLCSRGKVREYNNNNRWGPRIGVVQAVFESCGNFR